MVVGWTVGTGDALHVGVNVGKSLSDGVADVGASVGSTVEVEEVLVVGASVG